MPTLKCTTETVFQVNYQDFDDFVNETYGFEKVKHPWGEAWPYEFQQIEESSNDISHQYAVPTTWRDQDEINDEIDAWVESGGRSSYISAYTILEDLLNKGVIKPGTYIINVSW